MAVVNMIEVWDNGLTDAIERYKEYIDFSIMPLDEFKQECLDLINYYFENEMIGLDVNYNDIVSDTAKDYDMWEA